jgi:membrane protease YdiL (CAAX protease family)
MEPVEEVPPASSDCISCTRPLKTGAAFCSWCGHRVGDPLPNRSNEIRARVQQARRAEAGWGGVRSVILIYFSLLGGFALESLIGKSTSGVTAEFIGDGILAFTVIVVSLLYRSELKAAIGRVGFGWKGYAAILAASGPIVIAVLAYVAGLSRLFRLHQDAELRVYEGVPLAWTVLSFVVVPAIFEELAFRGVMFGLLRRSLEAREAIILTAVAFGLLHLSVPTLITHVPMGLYFGWLRHRSGSLYPSVLAHALHNGLVVAAETWSPWS